MASANFALRPFHDDFGRRAGWNNQFQRCPTVLIGPSCLDFSSDAIDLSAELRNARVEYRRYAKFRKARLDRVDTCEPAIEETADRAECVVIERIHRDIASVAVPPLPYRGRALPDHIAPGWKIGAQQQIPGELVFPGIGKCVAGQRRAEEPVDSKVPRRRISAASSAPALARNAAGTRPSRNARI